MTPIEQRSREIDEDRKAVEAAAILAILALLSQSESNAKSALRIGHSPAIAATAVINGTLPHQTTSILNILASAAVMGWLMGYWRSIATQAQYLHKIALPLGSMRKMVREIPLMQRPKPELKEIVDELKRLPIANGRTIDISATEQRLQTVADTLTPRLTERLNTIKIKPGEGYAYPFEEGAHFPDSLAEAEKQVTEAFRKSGLSPDNTKYIPDEWEPGEPGTASTIEAIVETLVGEEYDQGRDDGSEDGPASQYLWGWYWSSVIDGHECSRCGKLDGTTAPHDDPLWEQFGPLAHFGCRCSRIEIFIREGETPPEIKRPNMTDDDIIRVINDRRMMNRYWQGLTDTDPHA